MSSRVNQQRGRAVGHIQTNVEILAHVAKNLHRLTGREDSRGVGVDGVADDLRDH